MVGEDREGQEAWVKRSFDAPCKRVKVTGEGVKDAEITKGGGAVLAGKQTPGSLARRRMERGACEGRGVQVPGRSGAGSSFSALLSVTYTPTPLI